jgi:hypothetical protein
MKYIFFVPGILACAHAQVRQPSASAVPQQPVLAPGVVPVPAAECYALYYSEPVAGATARLFPTWIALLPPAGADGGNLPDFIRNDNGAYKGWEKIGEDSVRVRFTGTMEGVDLHLARSDSGVTGRAIWLTDLIGRRESSMRVTGTRQSCPAQVLSAK